MGLRVITCDLIERGMSLFPSLRQIGFYPRQRITALQEDNTPFKTRLKTDRIFQAILPQTREPSPVVPAEPHQP